MKKLLFAILTPLVAIQIAMFVVCLKSNAAEALIMWGNPPEGSTYNQYDIVEVQPDNSYWGGVDPRINPNSRFIIVQLTGLPVADFNQYFVPLYEDPNVFPPVQIRKRKFGLDITKIPANVVNFINNNDGFVTITEAQWNSYIKNHEGELP